MKLFSRLYVRAVFIIALSAIGFLTVPSSSYAGDGDRIAVVDVQKLMDAALAAKSLHQQLDVEQKKIEDARVKKENELRAFEEKVFAERKNLSKEELDGKKKEFDNKYLAAREEVGKRKLALDRAFEVSLTKIRKEIINASTVVAKKKGYSLVMSKQYIIMSSPDMDITSDVLEILNKNLPKVALEVNEN